jgi:poly(ADP-ribose) glycohydrolase ARH3
LIEKKKLDPLDLAERFWREFDREPGRGYGAGVVAVFEKLKQNLEKNLDPFEPASQQFGGKGSYGNGAAMRVHPVGLFFDDVDQVVESAKVSAKITHFNRDGINGAVLQAVATHCALKDATKEETIRILKNLAGTFDSEDGELNYVEQLEDVISMLEEPNHDFESGFELGNNVSAIESVPTAIYSFLKARDPVERLETANPFERTVQLALTFGGDSDTICSMAGALAGAFYGESGIPGLNVDHVFLFSLTCYVF